MNPKIILFGVLFLFTIKVQGQVKFGFELNAYGSKLTNIPPDTIVPWGYSGATVTHSPSYGIAPSFLLRKKIGNSLGLETGLGYWSNKYELHLRYTYTILLRQEVENTLKISLKYIQVPVSVFRTYKLNQSTQLNLSGGLRTRILIAHKDNFQDIIREKLGLHSKRYNKIVFVPTFGLGLNKKLSTGQAFEFGCFGTFNLNSLINREHMWGFYNNLHPAKNVELGLSVKFFFVSNRKSLK